MSPSVYRKIGGDTVHSIGFGLMGICGYYGAIDSDEERLKVLDAAYELGCRHWDSSNVYCDSEELIGKWLKRTSKRNEVFIATKFGITADKPRGDPAYARECLETSLKRVTMRELAEFVKEGKVKHIGLSECSAETLRRAHAIHPIAAVQVEVSPFVLVIWDEKVALAKTAQELGVAIVAYSPLARGMLTGRYKSHDDLDADDFRRRIPKYSNENFPKILDVVAKLQEIGNKHNATAGQVTLAWVLAKGDNFFVIPGTKKIKYLEENMVPKKFICRLRKLLRLMK
ncbi:hypothetical protein AX16_006392 [Volvariella volvacea WC 439]|nr:hypothetical protein AX16_006392 [Volvariella volvacea WC 439]